MECAHSKAKQMYKIKKDLYEFCLFIISEYSNTTQTREQILEKLGVYTKGSELSYIFANVIHTKYDKKIDKQIIQEIWSDVRFDPKWNQFLLTEFERECLEYLISLPNEENKIKNEKKRKNELALGEDNDNDDDNDDQAYKISK